MLIGICIQRATLRPDADIDHLSGEASSQLLHDARLYNNVIQEIGMLSLVRKGAWMYDSEYQPKDGIVAPAVRLNPEIMDTGVVKVRHTSPGKGNLLTCGSPVARSSRSFSQVLIDRFWK